ncbi:MAG: hypothetical protein B7Z37_14705 [Verrucomicrobia bacterium 12-59-8]|nr:MAG: hypothetical protein B7Z37_14705 [Verrucomicrobia bacterium 12-59-8]
MRRPWIKIEICTPDKPEICSLATQLRLDDDAVVGKLVRLWSWAELNRIDPNDLGVTKEFIDKIVGGKGFAAALEKTGWLIETNEKLSFRNFKRHNSPVAQNKALTAKRVARHRLRKAAVTEKVTDEPLAVKPVKAPKVKKSAAPVHPVEEVIKVDSTLIISEENVANIVPEFVENITMPAEVVVESQSVVEEPEVSAPAAPDEVAVDEPEMVHEAPLEEIAVPAPEVPKEEVAVAVPETLPEEIPTTAPEAPSENVPVVAQVEEPAPRKRRSKAADIDDQPMLF